MISHLQPVTTAELVQNQRSDSSPLGPIPKLLTTTLLNSCSGKNEAYGQIASKGFYTNALYAFFNTVLIWMFWGHCFSAVV